jgi:elongator complex protein 3
VLQEDEAPREIIEKLLILQKPDQKDLHRLKLEAATKYKLREIPNNAEIIAELRNGEKTLLLPILQRKITRGISGVIVVAIMTKPQSCPQPEPCAYCPGGPNVGSPQSYTGHEPAAMRGGQNNYDPYLQVQSRIDQLTAIGHKVDKVELIVMGGTFPASEKEYQTWFIQRSLDAITGQESKSLGEAKTNAENSEIRNVGITIETRPDWAKQEQIDSMLDMGVTRLEIGVQNPDDEIYSKVRRNHTVKDVQEATQLAKDSGLKIVYHMMPGMPGSTPEKDVSAFQTIFTDPAYKPDMIKIYPCLVIEGTKTHQWYKQGAYEPYSTTEATNLIAQIKRVIPPWVRVMRVQRDIPARLILAGVKKSNLRQLVQQKLSENGERCRCIRCREVGHKVISNEKRSGLDEAELTLMTYDASGGKEVFISFEDKKNDVLIGYLRLRIPSDKAFKPEISAVPSGIVRELHVYGPLVPVGKHLEKAWQHKGFGAKLLSEAEKIAKENYDLKKLLVISALGTKQYYTRFGYERDGVYVSKTLKN